MSLKTAIVAIVASVSASAFAFAEAHEYKIDSTHSGVTFKIRHFVNQVPGSFSQFSGTVIFDEEEPSNSSTTAKIEAKSVDTGNERRDGHLRNDDYFAVEKHPQITFESTKWTKTGADTYKVEGNLTLLGQTHPVTLDVNFLGKTSFTHSGNTHEVAGWVGKTKIDRTKWGMTAGAGVALGEEVEVEVSIQGRRQLEAAAAE